MYRPDSLPGGAKLLRSFEGHEYVVTAATFDPQADTVATCGDDTVKLWDLRSGTLLRTLEGHTGTVLAVAFSPLGRLLASGSADETLKVWDTESGELVHTCEGHQGTVTSVAFDATGSTLASGGDDCTVKLWAVATSELVQALEGQRFEVTSIAFDVTGSTLASGSRDGSIRVWDVRSGRLIKMLESGDPVQYIAFGPQKGILASANYDGTVRVWDVRRERLLRTLEGHTASVDRIAFSTDGRVLASRSRDETIRLWNCATWESVATVPVPGPTDWWVALALHPRLRLLATAAASPDIVTDGRSRFVQFWELDYDVLLGEQGLNVAAARAVHHTTAKIVLVGDHSVGKSALGYRLIHERFEKQESTHGQQFWVFPALGHRRADGTECEAILWDFAGQPDYRLVHTLFVDNADLALVLFDASDLRDPLHGVGFWLKQLQSGQSGCRIILVAAQVDRGTCSLSSKELHAFCQRHGIAGPTSTSAATGEGIKELIAQMKSLVPWEDKAATVTTTSFKRIKDYVLRLKEAKPDGHVIVTSDGLRRRLAATDADWKFTDAEILTAVGHLENYGYVKRLRTSKGEHRILLQPDRLNNLASSLVLEARRNPKGLGALEEKRLLHGGYEFPELKDLHKEERDVLLDSAAVLFLEHNVCFRETDPLRMEPYLVFPELINLKKPPEDEPATEDGVSYTVSGATENVFASLVVLLGYTHTFVRTAQWSAHARYEVGGGLVCGFRQESERDGELDFVLCFGPNVGGSVRALFQGLFESFLARRNVTIVRYEQVRCSASHVLNRAVVRDALQNGDEHTFCSKCGERLTLPAGAEPIQLSRDVQFEVESQRRAADQRTRFEQALFRVRTYIADRKPKIKMPSCFVSYAWGVPEHERWVEKRLASDLQKAGIDVVLDRWHNAQIGASIPRFIERIEKSDRIITVGTSLYRLKYDSQHAGGHIVAAEVALINHRLVASEPDLQSVLPLLLEGEPTTSLPPLLHDRVFADFRDDSKYFTTAFDVILSVYQIPHTDPAVVDLRESLGPLNQVTTGEPHSSLFG